MWEREGDTRHSRKGVNMESFRAYPLIPYAIAWVELFICERDTTDNTSSWDMLMKWETTCNRPDEVIAILQEVLETDISEKKQEPIHRAEHIRRLELARMQMELAQFRDYIAGKMGMM